MYGLKFASEILDSNLEKLRAARMVSEVRLQKKNSTLDTIYIFKVLRASWGTLIIIVVELLPIYPQPFLFG